MATPYGAIIGAVNDTLGGIAQTVVNHRFSDQSWKRQKKVLQNQIQWKVNDLRAAGLNPILAASSALAGGAPGVHTPQSADFGGGVSRGTSAGISARKVSPEVKALQAQTQANNAAAQASAMRAGREAEATNTERTMQAAQRAAAEASSANARQTEMATTLARQELPKARAMAEAWQSPALRETGKVIGVTGGRGPLTTGTAAGAAALRALLNSSGPPPSKALEVPNLSNPKGASKRRRKIKKHLKENPYRGTP